MTDQNDTTELPVLCRPAHVARYFGITIPTVYRWIKLGILPPPKKLAAGTSLWRREQIFSAFNDAALADIGVEGKAETS